MNAMNAMNHSTPLWQTLLQQALVGTQRADVLALPPPDGEADAMLRLLASAQAAMPSAEGAHVPSVELLRSAGAVAVWQRAGHVPQRASAAVELPMAPADTTEPAQGELARAVAQAMRHGSKELILQAWHILARRQLRLPTDILPAALEAGRANTQLRETLQLVIGVRGQWLAQQNTAWRYAAGTDSQADMEQYWSHGTLEQRLIALRTERERDPAAARARFEAALKELNAKERLAMLEVLRIELSIDDEPLLERLLDDRGSEVKQTAAEMLSALEGSAHAARIVGWLAPLLTQEGGAWKIEPPEAHQKEWLRDGISLKPPPYSKTGERAWWLSQLVRMSPLSWWMRTLDMSPAQIIEWARKTEWKNAIVPSLIEAVGFSLDMRWMDVLTSMHGGDRQAAGSLQTMLERLPLAEREQWWQGQLKVSVHRVFTVLTSVGSLLRSDEQLSRELSERISACLVEQLKRPIGASNWSEQYLARESLETAAKWLHVDALAALPPAIAAASEHAISQRDDTLARVQQISDIRRALHAA